MSEETKRERQIERQEMAEERTEWANERTEWAEERTEWAQHRTLLANERTFSAWLRTGLSAMAGGLAVAEFLGTEETTLVAHAIGVILVILGAVVCGVAYWRYTQITHVLEEEGLRITPRWMVALLVGGLVLTAVLVLILILMQ